ncbi:MAG: hypothetical protein AB7P34_13975, partial [Vicinamibacterales bacterium]
MTRKTNALMVLALLVTVVVGACSKKTPPVARPMPPPAAGNTTPPPAPPPPPSPVAEPVPVPPMPVEDTIGSKSLDDLNRESPLNPLFFEVDSSDVSADGQQVLQANAAVLKKYPTWQIT